MEMHNRDFLTEAESIAAHKQKSHPKANLTADIAIFANSSSSEKAQVLLVRRGGHPYMGCWALPGGFVEQGESVEAAAIRQLAGETGICGSKIEQFGTYSTPNRDPRGWIVTVAYVAYFDEAPIALAGDDAADAQWCPFLADIKTDGTIILIVTAGKDTLTVEFEIREGFCMPPRARVVYSKGFAFDHANIISDAYLCVRSLL